MFDPTKGAPKSVNEKEVKSVNSVDKQLEAHIEEMVHQAEKENS